MTSMTNLVIWTAVLTAAGFLFTIIAIAARIFSPAKLREFLLKTGKEKRFEQIADSGEPLAFIFSLAAVAVNLCIAILFLNLFENLGYQHRSIMAAAAAFWIGLFQVLIAPAWARYCGEKILARTYYLLKLAKIMFIPLGRLVKINDLAVRRLAGKPEHFDPDQQQEEKEEEFLMAIQEGRLDGAVDEIEQKMIEHILELDKTTAEQIMTPRTDIVAIKADSRLQEVLDTVAKEGHSRIPVYQGTIDDIIGLIYAKDLLGRSGNDGSDFNLKEYIRQPYFVPETKTVRLLLEEFQRKKLHIAIVLDEYGGTAGIVTIEDVLEEVVGEIADEYEEFQKETIKKIDENTIEADARTAISDFNQLFQTDLPDRDDYDTLAGFILAQSGKIPLAGEVFEYQDLKFTILSAEQRKINRIRVSKNAQKR